MVEKDIVSNEPKVILKRKVRYAWISAKKMI